MSSPRLPFSEVIGRLERLYGAPSPPPTTDPFELVLWENVAYLADDTRRRKAFAMLLETVGREPARILAASDAQLQRATAHGIMADRFAEKLREAAALGVKTFGKKGDRPLPGALPAARKLLRAFPGIGEPGAEKILLFSRQHAVLALESNGLRVLVRLGFGVESRNYAATYKSVRADVDTEAAGRIDDLIRAHLLLREHGQRLCRRTAPECGKCPLAKRCPSVLRSVHPLR